MDFDPVGTAPTSTIADRPRDRQLAVFGQTMGLVALTVGLFAFAAWAGRDVSVGVSVASFIGSIACLLGLGFTLRRAPQFATGLLFGMGALMGFAMGPLLAQYAELDPSVLWQAGAGTALVVGGFGAWGYATRRDLSRVARVAFWALLGLIVFGVVLAFVAIPSGHIVYAILGLVIFAAWTMVDFQRLRHTQDTELTPILAAMIFLDVLNVFVLFLRLFGR